MRGLSTIVFLAIFILIISSRQAIGLYVDWLWFQELGYTQVFTRSLFYTLLLGLLGGFFVALLCINVKNRRQTSHREPVAPPGQPSQEYLESRGMDRLRRRTKEARSPGAANATKSLSAPMHLSQAIRVVRL